MARRIREDLVGVTFAHTKDGGRYGEPLAAGDTVPDDVMVGDHLLAAAHEVAEASDDDAGNDPTPGGGQDDGGLEAPKGNASREDWAAYADALGVEYDESDGQKAIREKVAAHEAAEA